MTGGLDCTTLRPVSFTECCAMTDYQIRKTMARSLRPNLLSPASHKVPFHHWFLWVQFKCSNHAASPLILPTLSLLTQLIPRASPCKSCVSVLSSLTPECCCTSYFRIWRPLECAIKQHHLRRKSSRSQHPSYFYIFSYQHNESTVFYSLSTHNFTPSFNLIETKHPDYQALMSSTLTHSLHKNGSSRARSPPRNRRVRRSDSLP